ncbi:hypothetical protein F1559_001031 [Cyanidiococcus yangmingshanensis]|uniref:Uncharacterized protein n=1 Tax=Cyanidiococcus yangmingshanensis TaxID=2690220 RepID=A0A7J7IFL4_9RHOD|nr:hypothetical protein F1559_001031 [Cyanidiococcus yangmingshanensis]
MAEFADGVHGNGRVTEQLRRRFIFCSPEQWEASLKRALSEAALKEHERPSDFSAASDTTQQENTSPATQLANRELYESMSSSSSEVKFAGTRATPGLEAPGIQ